MFKCRECGRSQTPCEPCAAGEVAVKDRWLEQHPTLTGTPVSSRFEWGVADSEGDLVAVWASDRNCFLTTPGTPPRSAGRRYAWFELTLACPHRCRHCYLGDRLGRGHAPVAEVCDAFRAANWLGAQEAVLAGGEPTMHPHFATILNEALSVFHQVRVLTNGWTQSARVVEALAQARVKVEVPLLGWAEDHDWMTRTMGSFRRITASLRLYREAGINLTLTTTRTKMSARGEAQLRALAAELGIPFTISSLSRQGTAIEFWDELQLPQAEQLSDHIAVQLTQG